MDSKFIPQGKNVLPELKDLEVDEIKAWRQARAFPAAVAMMQIEHDFNFSSVVRNANAFGFSKVFYVSESKKWDKRGAVGTYHYIDVVHCRDEEQLLEDAKHYHLVGLENNTDYECHSVYDFDWPPMTLLLIGEEGLGLPKRLLEACDSLVTIPQYGTVPSVNAAVAAGIAMNSYCSSISKRKQ